MVATSVKILSAILGIYFGFIGYCKLSSGISYDMHKSLRDDHKELFKKSFFKIVVQKQLGVEWMKPSVYRKLMGTTELVSGGIMLAVFLPSIIPNIANVLLLLGYFDYLLSRILSGHGFDKSGSTFVFIILLSCRILLVLLTRQKNDKEKEAAKGESDSYESDEEHDAVKKDQ